MELLRRELTWAMRLAGAKDLASVDRSLIRINDQTMYVSFAWTVSEQGNRE